MRSRFFFDSNVWIYSLERGESEKSTKARTLLIELHQSGTLVVSYQNLQEILNVGFRKFRPVLTAGEAQEYIARLVAECEVLAPSLPLLRRAVSIRERYQFQWFDCLIVSSALEARCDVLYTEDLQHGQRIEGLQIVNPFL